MLRTVWILFVCLGYLLNAEEVQPKKVSRALDLDSSLHKEQAIKSSQRVTLFHEGNKVTATGAQTYIDREPTVASNKTDFSDPLDSDRVKNAINAMLESGEVSPDFKVINNILYFKDKPIYLKFSYKNNLGQEVFFTNYSNLNAELVNKVSLLLYGPRLERFDKYKDKKIFFGILKKRGEELFQISSEEEDELIRSSIAQLMVGRDVSTLSIENSRFYWRDAQDGKHLIQVIFYYEGTDGSINFLDQNSQKDLSRMFFRHAQEILVVRRGNNSKLPAPGPIESFREPESTSKVNIPKSTPEEERLFLKDKTMGVSDYLSSREFGASKDFELIQKFFQDNDPEFWRKIEEVMRKSKVVLREVNTFSVAEAKELGSDRSMRLITDLIRYERNEIILANNDFKRAGNELKAYAILYALLEGLNPGGRAFDLVLGLKPHVGNPISKAELDGLLKDFVRSQETVAISDLVEKFEGVRKAYRDGYLLGDRSQNRRYLRVDEELEAIVVMLSMYKADSMQRDFMRVIGRSPKISSVDRFTPQAVLDVEARGIISEAKKNNTIPLTDEKVATLKKAIQMILQGEMTEQDLNAIKEKKNQNGASPARPRQNTNSP